MTSATAAVGLTYRGSDIQNVDGIYLELKQGLGETPEVRGVDVIVPARSGRIVRNRHADRLPLILEGWVRGVAGYEDGDLDQFVTQRATFRTLFDRTLDPGALVATLEDGSTQHIDARTVSILWEQVVPSFARVNVELESVDPDWEAGAS